MTKKLDDFPTIDDVAKKAFSAGYRESHPKASQYSGEAGGPLDEFGLTTADCAYYIAKLRHICEMKF